MGGCVARSSFTVTDKTAAAQDIRTYPVLFSMEDAEDVMREASPGTYLLYKDFQSDRIYLSVRRHNQVVHHRILEIERLFYLGRQPYPYLDSIIFYHMKHKLKGVKLKKQAYLSARVVKAFTTKVMSNNGQMLDYRDNSNNNNINPGFHSNNGNYFHSMQRMNGRIWKCGSMDSLMTSSSGASW
ncbi:uncharacterized protein [Haliotis asinina]|uniref:uncharacterized protein n=1 Tax=Haliotis asinina TaxID=109174 RepID=UPI003531B297